MKKIIFLLALLSLGVSKAQVVGGYLPVNSTKSATMGGLRVNGTSTFTGNALFSSSVGIGALPTSSLSRFRSVTGTGTVDIGAYNNSLGGIWINQSSPTTGNCNIFGSAASFELSGNTRIYLDANQTPKMTITSTGVRVGSSVDPTSVLDVTGDAKVSSTFSLGSANLTGGNTGTVAVLSDALFPVTMKTSALGQSPADAQTYYFANIQFPNFSTEQGNGKIYFPYNVTLVGWTANFYVGTILGSAENSTLQINIDNSATNLSTAITMSALAQTYTNTGLSINVNANSYVEAKLITPTWATNPTNVFAGIIFWFVRRS